jgi:hypothetical protein
MRPRRSARVAAVEERETSALPPLPLSVVLHIFSLLPVDVRMRCAEVCRGWRSVLSERSLWTHLDFSPTSGVPLLADAAMEALLRAAVARARGGLQSLDVYECTFDDDVLRRLVAANAGTLTRLRVGGSGFVGMSNAAMEALLRAAGPRLVSLEADLDCTSFASARAALRGEPPFTPALRVASLCVADAAGDPDALAALAADVAAHEALSTIAVNAVALDTDTKLDAVVDAALARRMHGVLFFLCSLPPTCAPALARLVRGGALASLCVCGGDDAPHPPQLLDDAAAGVLAPALRASTSLLRLSLDAVGLWHAEGGARALCAALCGHVSLRELELRYNSARAAGRGALAGECLAAIVAANAPALARLDVSECDLGDDGLRPLFAALAHNSHLRKLDCSSNNMSEACARDALLPAVRANGSLRTLKLELRWPAARLAEELVRARPREA